MNTQDRSDFLTQAWTVARLVPKDYSPRNLPALAMKPCTDMAPIMDRVIQPAFNVSIRKVGGLRFVKVGRLTVSWSIAKTYKPL